MQRRGINSFSRAQNLCLGESTGSSDCAHRGISSTISLRRKHSRTNASRLFREASRVGDVCLRQPRRCGTESERRKEEVRERENAGGRGKKEKERGRGREFASHTKQPLQAALARVLLVCEGGQAGAKGGVCEMRWVPKAQRRRWQPRGYGARAGSGGSGDGGGGGDRRKDAARARGRSRIEGSRCGGGGRG